MIKEGKKKKQPGPFNPGLQEMVQYLYDKGFITADKDIADKTKYGKSTVSEYIGGNKEASPEFLKKFEEVFELKIPHHGSIKKSGLLNPSTKEYSIDDYINKIEEHNKFLQFVISNGLLNITNSLQVNFDKIHEAQDVAVANQQAWVEIIASFEAKEDEQRKKELMDKMGKIISSKTRIDEKSDTVSDDI